MCDGASETYTFAEFPVRIGRDESCELQVDHPFVSRKHARLERGAHGGFVLVDEGGRNGVTLGGLKLQRGRRIELVDGAEFSIDSLVAKVRFGEADEKATVLFAEHAVVPELLARAGAAMETYRAARAEALAVVSDSLAAIPEPQRASMIERLLSVHEELASDPGFRSLIDAMNENAASEALEGLQELAVAYVPDTRPPTDAKGIRAFLDALDRTLRTFLISKARLDSAYRPEPASDLDRARQLGASLLDWRCDTSLASSGIARDFMDLESHHAALVAGVHRIVAELSPAAVAYATKRSRWPFWARALWRELERRHADVVATLDQRFGSRFSRSGSISPDEPPRTLRLPAAVLA
jgi:hypothetical protein